MRLLLIALLLCPGPAWAGFTSSARGTSTADFLSLAVGARAEGLGEAYTAAADEATALYWNPAAMTQVPGNSVTLMHASAIGSTYFEYGSAVHNTFRYGAYGASVEYMTPGQLTETDDATGADVGTFQPRDLAVAFGYAYELFGFSAGVAGKFVQSRIITRDQTGALDFGLLSPGLFDNRLRFALAGNNLGGWLKFDAVPARLPFQMRVGAAFHATDNWLLSGDVGLPNDNDAYVALGTEYGLDMGGGLRIIGRAGFNSRTIRDVSGFSGGSFGGGMAFQNLSVDYAFLPFGAIGNVHRMSLSFHWGGVPSRPRRRVDAPERAAEKPKPAPAAAPAGLPSASTPEEYFTQAEQAIEAQRYDQAKGFLEGGAALVPEGDKRRARYFQLWGLIAYRLGDLAKAKAMYMEAVRLSASGGAADPVLAEADAGLGFVLIDQNDRAYGVKFLKKSLELGPSSKTRLAIEKKLIDLSGKR